MNKPLRATELDAVTPAKNVYVALSRAQAEMKNATLNKTNPHFKNKYADLVSLRAATLEILAKHGLAITQVRDITHDFGPILRTTLAHGESDTKIESIAQLPNCPDKPQIMGSAITYNRRYDWGSILGEASEEDDDANAAQSAGNKVVDNVALCQGMVNEIAKIDTIAALDKWRKGSSVADFVRLTQAQQEVVKDALAAKKEELA